MKGPRILSLDALELLLYAHAESDEEAIGELVDWHGEVLPYTEHGLEKTFTCAVCGKDPYVAYITRGAPGWCYVADKDGNFLADLRNQDWYCDDHTQRKKE